MAPSSVAFLVPWPASLPQQALEELVVLVEMVDGVVVVGAWALHELAESAPIDPAGTACPGDQPRRPTRC